MEITKFLSLIILVSQVFLGQVSNAAIISELNTDTSLGNGRNANLQGLEWLSLDVTAGLSRASIEDGSSGSWLSDGWRYATRLETETLITSLWGGHASGWAPNNFAGAAWFLSNWQILREWETLQTTGLDGSSFFFGDYGECSTDFSLTCIGTLSTFETSSKEYRSSTRQFSFGSIYWATLVTYRPNRGPAGFISDTAGADMGNTNFNSSTSNTYVSPDYGSLLVRAVPEPSTYLLLISGLLGLGAARIKVKGGPIRAD